MAHLALAPVAFDGRASAPTHDDSGVRVATIGDEVHHDAAGAHPPTVADRRTHSRAGVEALVPGEHVRP